MLHWIQYPIRLYVIEITSLFPYSLLGFSAWICCHGRAVPGCRFPVIDPLLADAVGSLDQIVAWAFPVLNHDNHSRVELPLRVIYVG